MPTVRQRDRVQELSDIAPPAPGAPSPLLLADESTLVVAYLCAPSGQNRSSLVRFEECFALHFGQPNDEAFASHPLAEQGLRPYGAFEVQSSSWVAGLEMRNRGHPHHDPQLFQRLRHWVWTFQDSVLECAALSYTAGEAPGRPIELLDRMQGLLRSG